MARQLFRNVVETDFHVRYAETDAMGIVHHANYLVWFEEGRSAFLRANETSYTAFEAEGLHLAVSEAQARYLTPAVYDQRVIVRCWVERVQSRKMRFAYEILAADTRQILATGYTEHICVTVEGKVARIPQKWLERFKRRGAP